MSLHRNGPVVTVDNTGSRTSEGSGPVVVVKRPRRGQKGATNMATTRKATGSKAAAITDYFRATGAALRAAAEAGDSAAVAEIERRKAKRSA